MYRYPCWYLFIGLLCFTGNILAEQAESKPTLFFHDSVEALIADISVDGNPAQQAKVKQWLHQIAQIPVGFSLLAAIDRSHHQLTIKHSFAARLSAGRTIAPMTDDLINGVGADVTIVLDLDMPDEGTHRVYDAANQPIEFTAVQNLYHELAHAMHQMRGTWRYFASEKQAIEAENDFRYQLALQQGVTPRLRYRTSGTPLNTLLPATAQC